MSPPPINIIQSEVSVTEVHASTNQEVIVITIDKMRLALLEHQESLAGSQGWQTPLATVIGIALTLSTTTFRASWGMQPEFWHAIFLIALLANVVWFIKAVIRALKCQKLDDLIERIKKFV